MRDKSCLSKSVCLTRGLVNRRIAQQEAIKLKTREHPCTKSVPACTPHADIAEAEGAVKGSDPPLAISETFQSVVDVMDHHKVKTDLYCPQTFLSLDFKCGDDFSEIQNVSGQQREHELMLLLVATAGRYKGTFPGAV